nr:hypothetical protein [Bacillus pacificus]
MKPQAISNQLQRLDDKGIVRSSREEILFGIVVDPCVTSLLHEGWCLTEDLPKGGDSKWKNVHALTVIVLLVRTK